MATKSGARKNARKGGSEEETVFKRSVSARHALDRVFSVIVFVAAMRSECAPLRRRAAAGAPPRH